MSAPADRPPLGGGAEPDRWHTLRRIVVDVVTGVGIVAVLVLVAFLISGVWPPFVAVESGSMAPHINEGDLVFLVQGDRFTGTDGVGETPYLTREAGLSSDHVAFGEPGHVVVFKPDGGETTPIIHRLHFWVDAGENWYDRAEQSQLGGHRSCEELPNCPAPHAGFVTKGDNNGAYDQVDGQSSIVRPEWIEGRAVFRVPFLGRLRVGF
ncbi:MAG: S26 family signal peptidase [Halobacteriales archaeon]